MKRRPGLIERALEVMARSVLARPWLVVGGYLVLAAGSAIAAAFGLELQTAQNALVSNDLDYNQRYHRYREEFGDQEYIYLVIEVGDDLKAAMAAADRVAARMERLEQQGYVKDCIHRLPLDGLERNALLYLPVSTLERLATLASSHGEALRALLAIDGFASLLERLLAIDPSSALGQPELARLGLRVVSDLVSEMGEALEEAAPTPRELEPRRYLRRLSEDAAFADLAAKWPGLESLDTFLRHERNQGYLIEKDLLLVLIMPAKDYETLELIREPLRRIRQVLEQVRNEFPGLAMGLTGRPVLQADQMETTNRDMTRATILAMLGVLFLFILFFRAVRRPILTAFVIGNAVAITFGMITLTIGHLNLLSVVFAVMLISLGTEFGVHVIARYQEELHDQRDIAESLRVTIVTAAKGNVTGGLTTAAAFYTTLLVDFKGLAELGFIAGTGIIICMISMNSLLPALLLITDRWRLPRGKLAPLQMTPLAGAARRPWWTLSFCALLFAAGLPFLSRVTFNSNLLELQADGLDSVSYEKLIIDRSGLKTWFGAYLAESRDEVKGLVEKLSDERYSGAIGRVESILDYVPDEQDRKLPVIAEVARHVRGEQGDAGVASWAAIARPADIERLRQSLANIALRLQLFVAAGSITDSPTVPRVRELLDSVQQLLQSIGENPRRAAERLGALQVAWFAVFRDGARRSLDLLEGRRVSTASLPPVLRRRVVSDRGRYLVYAYPARDIWDEENLDEFVRATHAVDPEVTGRPEQIYQSTRLMKRGFVLAAAYSLLAVFVLLYLDFRNLRDSLLAMLPVVLGLVWTFELMGSLEMSFNLANFFSIPIIIGDGINGGVHMIHRLREEPSADVVGGSTGTAVVMSALTTITGFGMLVLAQHRGIASLGSVMVLGSCASLVGSVVFLPSLLRVLARGRSRSSS